MAIPVEKALQMVRTAHSEATQLDIAVTAVVVDPSGRMVALGRMDKARPITVEMALNKAYTAVTFNPVDQADNLKKYGGFIPGVRPGRPTAEFLDRILARLTFPGALFLAAIAALPTILITQTNSNFAFGGTSILIVIGVALDTMKQLEAQLMMRNYEGFLK